jgi:glycosyltransferase involved in cell wall biosynthesis
MSPVIPAAAPAVSVMLVTYNHRDFIEQALGSVLAQRTTFPFEILISEDCSTDGTRDFVQEMQRRYPERIRLFLSERNQCDNEVLTRAWIAARGNYIAMLDGDDYWADPQKLQKQFDFLEAHPDIFICGHAVSVVDREGRMIKESKFDIHESRYLSPENLAWGYCFPVLSVFFRNNGKLPPHEVFNDAFNADTFMFAFFANFGGGYVSKEIMGAYRAHAGGIWSSLDRATGIDHRNETLRRIPRVLEPRLKAVAYCSLLWHSVREDYRWGRKIKGAMFALLMALRSFNFRAAGYFGTEASDRAARWLRETRRSANGAK